MTRLKHPVNYVLRVYALIINESQQVLLSDEYQMDMKMVKFPGGGMEPGEGTLDCLQREAREEFGQELADIRHFYTTDFYQQALFYKDHQLISIYYLAGFAGPVRFPVSEKPFDFPVQENGSQSFRWVSIERLEEKDLTFPVDKKVLGMLKKHIREKKR